MLLRRRVVKQWTKLTPEMHQVLKQSLLQVLIHEPIQLVRHGAGQVVSVIAKFEVPVGQWPELLQFLQEYIKSKRPEQREVCENEVFGFK